LGRGSNPPQGMNICLYLCVFYADKGLEQGSCRMHGRLNEASTPFIKTIETMKEKKSHITYQPANLVL
jgi:hypothetical protein